MALIKCPECGKEFSDTATTCPHCGYSPKTIEYGTELGKGIKEGLKGLNTVASPKKKSTCIKLTLIPFVAMIVMIIGGESNIDFLIGLGGFLLYYPVHVIFMLENLKRDFCSQLLVVDF